MAAEAIQARQTTVSVVIPCYGYGRYLEDAVASVLEDAARLDVQVLIIDDASPDDSAEVAHRLAAGDARVAVVVHPRNRGHIATYNEGLLEWASGDYTVLLSADDRLTPGALTRATDLLNARPDVGLVYGRALPFGDSGPLPPARTYVRGWSIWPGEQWLERRFRLARSGISSPEVVVRTSLQREVGGYDPRLPHHGDTEMWVRMAARANVGFLRGVDQAYYRKHTANMSTSYNLAGTDQAPLLDLHQRRLAFESAVDRCAGQLSDAPGLLGIVRRKLAWEALFAATRAFDKGQADRTPIDALVDFAVECWPDARRMPIYASLRLRRRIGSRRMRYVQPFMPSERATRFAVESRDRYDSLWEAFDAVATLHELRRARAS